MGQVLSHFPTWTQCAQIEMRGYSKKKLIFSYKSLSVHKSVCPIPLKRENIAEQSCHYSGDKN